LTLAENVSLPLELSSGLSEKEIKDIVSFKLALVGLAGFEERYPAELSGGMRKRAGLARAMALDPEILFFDEPSAGLDPVTARRLDELILELRQGFSTTTVVVTHDLDSIMTIGSQSIFLDAEVKTMTAFGPPKALLEQSSDPRIIEFLTRGERSRPAAEPQT
jgi:phospholipid/cholesterol/gamma-HCH transport system ATP-binding protein